MAQTPQRTITLVSPRAGDIDAVSPGTNMDGGGSSGTVILNFDPVDVSLQASSATNVNVGPQAPYINPASLGTNSPRIMNFRMTREWVSANAGGPGGGGATNNVNPLILNAVVLGGGGDAVATMPNLGTSGFVLTSNGVGAAPTWQAAPSTPGGSIDDQLTPPASGTDTGFLERAGTGGWVLRPVQSSILVDGDGNVITDDAGNPILVPSGGASQMVGDVTIASTPTPGTATVGALRNIPITTNAPANNNALLFQSSSNTLIWGTVATTGGASNAVDVTVATLIHASAAITNVQAALQDLYNRMDHVEQGGGGPPPTDILSSISLQNTSFTGPATNAGQTIGAVLVTADPAYTGLIALAGPDAARFTLSNGGTYPCNLVIGSTDLTPGTYDIRLEASRGGTTVFAEPSITIATGASWPATTPGLYTYNFGPGAEPLPAGSAVNLFTASAHMTVRNVRVQITDAGTVPGQTMQARVSDPGETRIRYGTHIPLGMAPGTTWFERFPLPLRPGDTFDFWGADATYHLAGFDPNTITGSISFEVAASNFPATTIAIHHYAFGPNADPITDKLLFVAPSACTLTAVSGSFSNDGAGAAAGQSINLAVINPGVVFVFDAPNPPVAVGPITGTTSALPIALQAGDQITVWGNAAGDISENFLSGSIAGQLDFTVTP